jgi:hypothetical protein
MVALGATKQFLPNSGDLPLTGSMSAIVVRFDFKYKATPFKLFSVAKF